MNDLFDWPTLIILAANTVGLLVALYFALSESRMSIGLIIVIVVFGGVILVNVIFPGREFSGVIGSMTSVLALFLLVGFISALQEKTQTRNLSAKDEAIVDDFHKWASGGGVGQKKEVSGFSAYASRDRNMDRDATVASQNNDPVCSNCGTVYNREVVISLIKQQSPEIFDFQSWTTKFICNQCREEIVISGSRHV